MGGCSSRNSSSTVSNVRVVHLNGWIEDYDFPVSVSQVTGSPPNHFVFTAAQLLSTVLKPLKPDTLLERGRLYFVVPSAAFQADFSPAELATIVKKLTAKAKSCKAEANMSPGTSPVWGQYGSSLSPVRRSPGRSSNRVLEGKGALRCSKKEPWKPFLDTIRERSFNRRSESDLQEMQSERYDSILR